MEFKTKLKVLFFAALLGISCTANAQTKMIVETNSGSSEYVLGDVSKITFAASNLNVNMFNNNTSPFAYSAIKKIVFVNTNSIDNNLTESKEKHIVYCNGGVLYVKNWKLNDVANLTIYSTSGQVVELIKGWNGQSVNLNHLSNGMYIVKINNETNKIIKK